VLGTAASKKQKRYQREIAECAWEFFSEHLLILSPCTSEFTDVTLYLFSLGQPLSKHFHKLDNSVNQSDLMHMRDVLFE
jgi:hypothetical protein